MIVRWNLTRHASQARAADAIVLSVGKSGRTWLRVLLNRYLAVRFDVPFRLDDLAAGRPEMPSVHYSHEIWLHLTVARWSQRLLGRYVIPDRVLARKKLVLLHRDPRDVVVSLFFQMTRRSRKRLDTTLPEFIRHPGLGAPGIVRVMNRWCERLRQHPRCRWLGYEGLQEDPGARLREVAGFLGVPPRDPEQVAEAVAFADFRNMRGLEASGAFDSAVLRPGDPSDPQSFKVREGKVGGYRKHFGREDLAYLDRAVAALDPRFGYGPTAAAPGTVGSDAPDGRGQEGRASPPQIR